MILTNLITQIIFYIFAIGAIMAALVVVSTRNPVKGVLFLVLCFVAMAGVWILLHAEFLALILVVVYVGAVMTLFLFVVMMLNIDIASLKQTLVRYFGVGLLIVFFIFLFLFMVVGPKYFGLASYPVPEEGSTISNVQQLGFTLFNHYVYSFEIAGVLLLVAMVASISLAFRGIQHRKNVKVDAQLAVRREDRIKLVQIDVEVKKQGETV